MATQLRSLLVTQVLLGIIPLGCGERAQPSQVEGTTADRSIDNPVFVLPGPIAPSACRLPTSAIIPLGAEAGRWCRQMKQVQAWLNLLLDSRTLFAPAGVSDTDRRESFFGDAADGDDVGRQLTRVAAVLLASDCPIDSQDYELGIAFVHDDNTLPGVCGVPVGTAVPVDEWLWELPHAYADEPNIQKRAKMMREDAAEWLLAVGIPKFELSPGSIAAYDEKMIKILKMTYMIASSPERFDGLAVGTVTLLLERLILQKFDRTTYDPPQYHIDDDWVLTKVPMSGQDFDEYMEEENNIAGAPMVSPETENHVLNALIYHYLINQLITVDNENYLSPDQYLGDLVWAGDAIEWFEYAGTDLEDLLVEVVSRVMYNGMFETNANPYQRISIEALLMLSNYALEDRVRNAAINALHYLATKNAFQTLGGQSYAPRRRSCDQAWRQTLVTGVDRMFAVLSGHFKWNDSPYGFRGVADELATNVDACLAAADPDACFANFSWPTTSCESDPDCHWQWYTWKRSQMLTTNAAKYTHEGGGIPSGQGSDVLASYLSGFSRHDAQAAFWAAFSNYVTPEAVRSFSANKRHGYWARAMARYHLGHYYPKVKWYQWLGEALATHQPAQYFDAIGEPYSNGTRVQRTPELWFAGPDFMNVSGGMFNSYYGDTEESRYYAPAHQISQVVTCSGEDQWNNYVDDYSKNGDFHQIFGDSDMGMQDFDAFARPTALLFGTPSINTGTGIAYVPYGLSSFPYEVAKSYMPMMVGNERAPWRSVNVGTYKNFSYGYLQHCNPTDSTGCDYKYGEWALSLPDYGVTPHTFSLDGNSDIPVRFAVYDLRNALETQGLSPAWLVTGKVWKKRSYRYSMGRFARSFWEVVPGDWYDNAQEIEDLINETHSAADFPEGTWPENINKEFRYRLLSTRETMHMAPQLGAVWPAAWYKFDLRVQGITRIEKAGGGWLDRATYYINLWDSNVMNHLPLLDVKAVDEHYRYLTMTVDNEEYPRYYTCAQDGWMCVNSFHPDDTTATRHYLWVDSRPKNGQWAPYWEAGTYSPTETWACGCGTGGPWTPGPPATAVPVESSGGSGGGGDGGGTGDDTGSGGAEIGTSSGSESGSGSGSGSSGTGDSGGDEIGSDTGSDDGSLGDDGGFLGPCTSSISTTPECTYPDPSPDCPHGEHICGFVGANKATETATCVCLTDEDACYPPTMPFNCQADDDCESFGDAFCQIDTVTLEGTCVCTPEAP